MIKVIKGNDKVAIQNYIYNLRNTIDQHVYTQIEGYNKNKSRLNDSLNSLSILNENFVFHIILDSTDTEIDVNTLESNRNLYILNISNLNGNTKVVKELKKKSTIITFDSKVDFATFNIAESLLIHKDLNSALKIANRLGDNTDIIFSLLNALHYYYKLIYYKNNNHPLFYKQKLFVQNKIAKAKYSDKELKALLLTIFKYDNEIKSSGYLNLKKMIKDIYIKITTL